MVSPCDCRPHQPKDEARTKHALHHAPGSLQKTGGPLAGWATEKGFNTPTLWRMGVRFVENRDEYRVEVRDASYILSSAIRWSIICFFSRGALRNAGALFFCPDVWKTKKVSLYLGHERNKHTHHDPTRTQPTARPFDYVQTHTVNGNTGDLLRCNAASSLQKPT